MNWRLPSGQRSSSPQLPRGDHWHGPRWRRGGYRGAYWHVAGEKVNSADPAQDSLGGILMLDVDNNVNVAGALAVVHLHVAVGDGLDLGALLVLGQVKRLTSTWGRGKGGGVHVGLVGSTQMAAAAQCDTPRDLPLHLDLELLAVKLDNVHLLGHQVVLSREAVQELVHEVEEQRQQVVAWRGG